MHDRNRLILTLGDLLVLLLVTWIGFASHGEAQAFGRMPSTFIPLVVAWAASAVPFGLYRLSALRRWQSLGKVLWAALLAAPLAAWLRAIWLGTAVLPVFVAVLGAFTALFLLVWRAAFWFFSLRNRA